MIISIDDAQEKELQKLNENIKEIPLAQNSREKSPEVRFQKKYPIHLCLGNMLLCKTFVIIFVHDECFILRLVSNHCQGTNICNQHLLFLRDWCRGSHCSLCSDILFNSKKINFGDDTDLHFCMWFWFVLNRRGKDFMWFLVKNLVVHGKHSNFLSLRHFVRFPQPEPSLGVFNTDFFLSMVQN